MIDPDWQRHWKVYEQKTTEGPIKQIAVERDGRGYLFNVTEFFKLTRYAVKDMQRLVSYMRKPDDPPAFDIICALFPQLEEKLREVELDILDERLGGNTDRTEGGYGW